MPAVARSSRVRPDRALGASHSARGRLHRGRQRRRQRHANLLRAAPDLLHLVHQELHKGRVGQMSWCGEAHTRLHAVHGQLGLTDQTNAAQVHHPCCAGEQGGA